MNARIAIIFLILFTSEVKAEYAYLIIEARAVGENTTQPYWIGLRKTRARIVHVPAGDTIVKLHPSVYNVHHIDFTHDRLAYFSTDHDYVILDIKKVLELEADTIYLFGSIFLDRQSSRKVKIDIGDKIQLLKKACNKDPDLFNTYYVNTMSTSGEIRIKCK